MNQISPQIILKMIEPAIIQSDKKELPEHSPTGFGRKVVADFCHEYNLNIKKFLHILDSNGFEASVEKTFKKVAQSQGITPGELYERVKDQLKSIS